jgi:hypothetical protein
MLEYNIQIQYPARVLVGGVSKKFSLFLGCFLLMSHFRAQSQEGLGTVCNWCIMMFVLDIDIDRWEIVRAMDHGQFGRKIREER